MNAADVKKLNDAELIEKLAELSKELFNLKIQAKTGQLENSARVGVVKKTVARIKTEQVARTK